MSNANAIARSPLRCLIQHRPAFLGSPDRTSSSVSSYSYSLDDDNSDINTSTEDKHQVYDTTNTDTNVNQRSSGRSARLSHMLFGKLTVWSIFIFIAAIVSVLPAAMFTSDPPVQVLNKSTGDSRQKDMCLGSFLRPRGK